jgi:hypothetical protein
MNYLITIRYVFFCFLFLFAYFSESDSQDKESPVIVKGRVVDYWGVPVSKVELSFYKITGDKINPISQSLIGKFKADQRGEFQIEGLPLGIYRVHVENGDFCCVDIPIFYLYTNQARILDVGLPLALTDGLRRITVKGKITGLSNKPIDNATITFINAFDFQNCDQVRTNTNGDYELTTFQPGQYILYAFKPGFIVSATVIALYEGATEKRDIVLKPDKGRGILSDESK